MVKAFTTKSNVSQRMSSIRRVLWVVLFLNLAVAVAKYSYGTISGSASMQADGIHSVFDSAGNVVGLVGIVLASRPADEGHPYGHAKFETYASLIIGVLLVFAAYEVGSSALQRLLSQSAKIEVGPLSFVVMIATLIINLGVTFYERRQGKVLRSEILTADASHTFSDALVSMGVIVGLFLVLLGFPLADPVMALVVTLAIVLTAYDVFKCALSTLSDHARIPTSEIRCAVLALPGVRDAHRIRTRGTEGEIYADLHVLVAPTMSVLDAHNLADQVELILCDRFAGVVDVMVHVEPDDGHRG